MSFVLVIPYLARRRPGHDGYFGR